MDLQAYFENISEVVQSELESAQKSIYIAVAWFTDKELFRTICEKARSNIKVELILVDDEINSNSELDFQELKDSGVKVLWIKNDVNNGKLMHNKFCVIDAETVITGSYNWRYHSKQSHENITVIKDDVQFANHCISEFDAIKIRYTGEFKEQIEIDINRISARLEAIRNVIVLQDEEDIVSQTNKLKKVLGRYSRDEYKIVEQAVTIVNLLSNKKYEKAVKQIDNFLSQFRKIIRYVDQEIIALKLELKSIEFQINSLDNEKADLEKLILEFEICHNRELGELILKILDLRRKKFKSEAKKDSTRNQEYEEAEQDYKEYHSDFSEIQFKKYVELSPEDEIEIKKLYRRASKLCHPDVVNDEQKEQAEKIFSNLNKAYQENNIEAIRKILDSLDQGNFFVSKSQNLNEADQLRIKVSELEQVRDELLRSIMLIKESETYQTIINIRDWNIYFKETREKLENELNNLQNSKDR